MHLLRLLLLACAASAVSASLSTRDVLVGFRDVFAAHCRRHNASITDADIMHLMLLPTDDLIATQDFKSVADVDAAFLARKPSDLELAGRSVPITAVDAVAPLLARQQSGNPVTIVVIGGMMGEFIPNMALGAAYNAKSKLAKEFASRLKKAPVKETIYDTKKLKNIEVSLGDIVLPTSVELPNGTALYNVVYLKQHEGSLESLRDSNIVVPGLISRIGKFLDVAGDLVNDFVVLGYSRGGLDAVEVMSRADELPWGKRMRGVITQMGVNWGLQDCVPPESAVCKAAAIQLPLFENLLHGLVPNISAFSQNLKLLEDTMKALAEANKDVPPITDMNTTKIVFPDLYRTWDELVKGVLFGLFDIWHPVKDYGNNIRRVQMVLTGFDEALHMLSSSARAEWWRTHTLPADRLYLSVTATQQDPSVIFDVLHPDEYSERGNYYTTHRSTGHQLADGSVTTCRERILSGLHMAVNPQQKPYQPQWACVIQSDHWGGSLDYVIPTPDHWKHPFQRFALIDSLATWVAIHS